MESSGLTRRRDPLKCLIKTLFVMKKVLLTFTVVAVAGVALSVARSANLQQLSFLATMNFEALAYGEGGGLPAGYEQGRSMGTVTIGTGSSTNVGGSLNSDGTGSVNAGHTWNREKIRCCLPSDQGNACDRTAEDSRCRSHV